MADDEDRQQSPMIPEHMQSLALMFAGIFGTISLIFSLIIIGVLANAKSDS